MHKYESDMELDVQDDERQLRGGSHERSISTKVEIHMDRTRSVRDDVRGTDRREAVENEAM